MESASSPATPAPSKHAVVIGASIAGCLAARVLRERFERVTVLERNTIPSEPAPRKGVPQENHVHLLLQRGKHILANLFPGFLNELEQKGALVADLSRDIRTFQHGRWRQRFDTDIRAHYCSRGLFDSVIRQRLALVPGITFISQAEVASLRSEDGGRHIQGVTLTQEGKTTTMEADLVVDASGRGSRTEQWFKSLGIASPERSVVAANLGYATRIYRQLPRYTNQWKVLLVLPKPPYSRRMGVISPIEDQRWMVTTSGWLGDHPPSDEGDYLEFLRNLPVPDIYEVIREAEPLSEISLFRMPGGLRRHYERVTPWPGGFLVIGDALCSVNPIYSQGMSICAMEAEVLNDHIDALARPSGPACHAVQQALAQVVAPAWGLAESEDMRFPELGGERPLSLRWQHWYGERLVEASARNRDVSVALLRVTNLMDDGRQLQRPGMMMRVLTESLKQRLFGSSEVEG
ncbi:FAD-dependent oxidoreductase [Myxococcus vastator]|uniref:FAD-dependent oxidoreductase n=1 Tax=Myxococcus vastator TaxID=2709664 RepID=UPI0013CFC7CB|nr:FAD-dependent oxidoreductase [Myxococcus vastator]